MADPNALLHDPRRRNLAVLAIVAVAMVGFAALALWHQASLVAPKYTPHRFFPGLAEHNRAVARIHIDSKAHGSFDIAFKPSVGWVLPGRRDYPADVNTVRETIIGMGSLETVAPKTGRADWLHYLDLVAPSKGGKGTEITLLDENNKVMASLIAGKTKDIGDPGGATGLFVRKPGSNRSWLVRSVFTPKPDPNDWLNKDIIDIDRARIAEADVSPPDGPTYVVRRAKAGDADFKLADMPKGRELAYPSAPDGVAAALTDFTFDNVAPAIGFDFSDAAELVTKTFDGLTVTARIIKKAGDYWLTLSAEAEPGKKDAQAEARAIDRHAAGWAFQIPAYKGAQFTTSRESLLKPKGSKPAKGHGKKK